MAPDPLSMLPATPGATTVMPTAAAAGGVEVHVRRQASMASFAGNLQAALAQSSKAGAIAVAGDPVADATEAQTTALIAVPGLAAPPVAVAVGATVAGVKPQDRAPAGKAPGAAASPARPPGPAPLDTPAIDAPPSGLVQPILVPSPSAPPPAPSALTRADFVAAEASGARPAPAAPAEPAGSGAGRSGAGRAAPQAEAVSTGPPVETTPTTAAQTSLAGAAIPSAAEAAPAGIPLSALAATPTFHAERAQLVDSPTASPAFPSGSPAQQVAPALLLLGNAASGTQRLTLRLDPAALGQVEIRIDRPASGPAEIRIAAERPETLALLQHDRHQLEQALDQAGIPAARQIDFQIAPRIEPAITGGAPTPDVLQHGGGQPGGDRDGSGGRDGGAGRQGRADRTDADIPSAAPRWLRAGVDITA